MPQHRIKIFGPPGTGKTNECLDLLCSHLQAGDRVLFISFTKAAQIEANDRLIRMFGAVPEHAKVSTIHALCFHLLNMNKGMLADRPDFRKKFLESIGITGTRGDKRDRATHALELYARIRNTEGEIDFNEEYEPFYDPKSSQYIATSYDAWKKDQGYMDFTDLLERVADGEGELPTWDIVIIDEAQDLTPLQWRVAERLYENASTIYVVGDDDQNVYGFLGANVNHFLGWACDAHRVLDYTHRLPKNVLDYSLLLAKRIKRRMNKTVRADSGKTGAIYDDIGTIENLTYNTRPSELYLVRNAYMEKRIQSLLISQGIPFRGKRSPFTDKISYAGKAFQGIHILHTWRNSPLHIKDWRLLKPLMRKITREHLEYKFPEATTSATVEGIPPLTQIWKESFQERGFWEQFIPDLHPKLAASFKVAIDKYGLDRCSNPTLELSTIHGAKGKEADRVYVCSALTDKIHRKLDMDDNEHRLFYVAVTRTKNELFLLNDETAGAHRYYFPNSQGVLNYVS